MIHTCLPHLRNFLNEYWLKSRCLCRINDCLNWKLNSARRCWLACKRVHIISINNYTELVEMNDLKFNRNDLIIGFLLLLSHQGNSGFLSLCSFSCHEYRAWHATPPFVLYMYIYSHRQPWRGESDQVAMESVGLLWVEGDVKPKPAGWNECSSKGVRRYRGWEIMAGLTTLKWDSVCSAPPPSFFFFYSLPLQQRSKNVHSV